MQIFSFCWNLCFSVVEISGLPIFSFLLSLSFFINDQVGEEKSPTVCITCSHIWRCCSSTSSLFELLQRERSQTKLSSTLFPVGKTSHRRRPLAFYSRIWATYGEWVLATAASKGRSLDSILKGSRRVTFNLTRNVAGLNTCVRKHIARSGTSVCAPSGRTFSK